MATGWVWTRNLPVLDPAGAGAGLLLTPRVFGFGDPKRGGSGSGFHSPPQVPVGDPKYEEPATKAHYSWPN